MKMKSMKKATLMLCVLAFMGCENTTVENKTAENDKFIGPYVQKVTTEDVTIRWATQKGLTTISKDGELVNEATEYDQHKIEFTNLDPNTTYTYDVLNDGTNKGQGSFTTYSKGKEPFKFSVLGDTRTRHDVHGALVDQIIEGESKLVLNTGDIINRGREMSDWESFFEVSGELMKSTPYYSVLGNHEQNADYYFDFMTMPGNGRYYFFTVGDALFVGLDLEGPGPSLNYTTPEYIADKGDEVIQGFWTNIRKEYFEEEKEWLENVLEVNKDAGYIFVFTHDPFYTVREDRVKKTETRNEYWVDTFEKHDVTAVFSGHDHHYNHAEKNGIEYFVTGGAGAKLYDADVEEMNEAIVKFEKKEHYLSVDVEENGGTITTIDLHGNIMEETQFEKRKNTN